MATYKQYQWPGLANPVYLPDWITVEVKLITNSRFRSFQKSGAHTRTTFHDTGNPSTNADAEWTWANNGRQGAGVGGYNGIFDSGKVIICQPFDEVVWAAGTPEGNRTSYHFEMAYGAGQDFARVLDVGHAVHGAICAAKGWSADTALVKHQYWYGKWCPAQILNRGIWSGVVKGVTEAADAAKRAAAGNVTDPTPQPEYASPSPIAVLDKISMSDGVAPSYVVDPSSGVTCIFVGDRYEAIRDTPRRRYAVTDSEIIGPPIKRGESFDVDWLLQNDAGWWAYTPYATRVYLDDLKRVADVKGAAA